MKFIIEAQHGIKQSNVIVWDAEQGKELCTFVDGEFETEDEYTVKKLIELGYKGEGQTPNPNVMTDDEIREKAKELGIKSWHIKSIETLEKEIAEKEGV
jgi:hypothetical protein